jgi:hypothetical protein
LRNLAFSGAVFACALFALSIGDAGAQVLYKWVDADGKTQYSDKPPKNFTGTVTRMEPDEQPAAAPAYRAPARIPDEAATPQRDMAATRRELRRKLGENVALARANLESAKAALEGAVPQDDERQVIQQRVEKDRPVPGAGSASTGGMFGSGGMMGGPQRSNCKTVKDASGRTVTTCPTSVPNDAYYERAKKLEEAVKAAEEALEAAEQAYRRGAD